MYKQVEIIKIPPPCENANARRQVIRGVREGLIFCFCLINDRSTPFDDGKALSLKCIERLIFD